MSFHDVISKLREKPNRYPKGPLSRHTGNFLDSRMLEQAAIGLGLKTVRLDRNNLRVDGHGLSGVFYRNLFSTTSLSDRRLTNDKNLTKLLLSINGLPVPQGGKFVDYNRALACMRRLGKVAVKPLAGSLGRGVTAGIETEADFAQAWAEARAIGSRPGVVIVEEFVPGVDIRVMVVGGKAVGAIYRMPANVTGDGHRSIRELIEARNEIRRKIPYYATRLIPLDASVAYQLAKLGMDFDTVPPEGQEVRLQAKANLSAGGDGFDITDHIHPELMALCERAMDAFPRAGHGGVDLLCEDFTRPPEGQRHTILELNLNNEIAMHRYPLFGTPRNLAVDIVRHYCTEGGHLARTRDRPDEYRQVVCTIPGIGDDAAVRDEIDQRAGTFGLDATWLDTGESDLAIRLNGSRSDLELLLLWMHQHPRLATTLQHMSIRNMAQTPTDQPNAAALPAAAGGQAAPAATATPAAKYPEGTLTGLALIKFTRRKILEQHLLVQEARKRGIEVWMPARFRLSLRHDGREFHFVKCTGTVNSTLANKVCLDKAVTSQFLRGSGVDSPENCVFTDDSADRAWAWAQSLLPVVLKPVDGIKGRDVYVEISDRDDFFRIYATLRQKGYSRVLCEKFLEGESYRFTVVGNRLVAAYKRRRAQVVGNGTDTVADLIRQDAQLRARNPRYSDVLLSVDDPRLLETLRAQGIGPGDVPADGQVVILSNVMNRSAGATLVDATPEITGQMRRWIERASKCIPGLALAGWDVIQSPDGRLWVLEINHNPAFATHFHIWDGQPRNVAIPLMDLMFPATAAKPAVPPGKSTSKVKAKRPAGRNGSTATVAPAPARPAAAAPSPEPAAAAAPAGAGDSPQPALAPLPA